MIKKKKKVIQKKAVVHKEKKTKRSSSIFVISGPGGAGKTTLVDQLFESQPIQDNFVRGISFTTREMRPQEKEGVDYCFVDEKEFSILQKGSFFLETQQVLHDYYGTPKYFLNQAKKERKSLLLCIDVKGGIHLKKHIKKNKVITIFVSAPNSKELQRRLQKRVEKDTFIKERLELAKKELQFGRDYDYLLVNRNIGKSIKELTAILLGKV